MSIFKHLNFYKKDTIGEYWSSRSLNTTVYIKETMFMSCIVDKKATIRNRYNQIPDPALSTKREMDTYN